MAANSVSNTGLLNAAMNAHQRATVQRVELRDRTRRIQLEPWAATWHAIRAADCFLVRPRHTYGHVERVSPHLLSIPLNPPRRFLAWVQGLKMQP